MTKNDAVLVNQNAELPFKYFVIFSLNQYICGVN